MIIEALRIVGVSDWSPVSGGWDQRQLVGVVAAFVGLGGQLTVMSLDALLVLIYSVTIGQVAVNWVRVTADAAMWAFSLAFRAFLG